MFGFHKKTILFIVSHKSMFNKSASKLFYVEIYAKTKFAVYFIYYLVALLIKTVQLNN